MAKNGSNELHSRKHAKSPRILGTLAYMGDIKIPITIELVQYNEKQFMSKNIQDIINIKEQISSKYVNWFKVMGISDADAIYTICKSFGMKRFDIKDMLSANRVTKVITYESITFVLMSGCFTTESQDLAFEKVAFILGNNFVISFQESSESIFDDVKEAIRTSRVNIRERSSDYLLYILLNDVYSLYNDTLLKLSDKVDEMEDHLIEDDIEGVNVMKFIQTRKKESLMIKRSISSMREEYVNLLHNTNSLIKKENKAYFNDFEDKLRTMQEDLEVFYLSINSLTDLYFDNNNLQMNNVIKKLTIVSTIFIPLTFMVGVWGMNFESMPELGWSYGYLFAWGTMALIVLLAVFYLKHKKWF